MALLMLECSGKKPAGALRASCVQAAARSEGRHEAQLRKRHPCAPCGRVGRRAEEQATSWGPFQLMGYKCILLDVNIRDIRGLNGVEHGADWINQTYGNSLRAGRFKDCFHMHNTGVTLPQNRSAAHPRSTIRAPRFGHDEPVHRPRTARRHLSLIRHACKQVCPSGTGSSTDA